MKKILEWIEYNYQEVLSIMFTLVGIIGLVYFIGKGINKKYEGSGLQQRIELKEKVLKQQFTIDSLELEKLNKLKNE